MTGIPYGIYGLGGVLQSSGTIPTTPDYDNSVAIAQDILSHLSVIQTWIQANSPGGAVLTAAQTLVLARLLDGMCQILLTLFSSTANA